MELFARLDPHSYGVIQYQHCVERLQALDRASLLLYGLTSDKDIVRFTSALWDLKYGPAPPTRCALHEEVYGRAPSHTLFHEHCLDHETHAGPQGRATVIADTRAQVRVRCSLSYVISLAVLLALALYYMTLYLCVFLSLSVPLYFFSCSLCLSLFLSLYLSLPHVLSFSLFLSLSRSRALSLSLSLSLSLFLSLSFSF